MSHKISEDCINCGSCVDECPVEAISEGEEFHQIDQNMCTDCSQCVEMCPTEAIGPL